MSSPADDYFISSEDAHLFCPSITLTSGGTVSAGGLFTLYSGCGCLHTTDKLVVATYGSSGNSGSNNAAPLLQLGCVDGLAAQRRRWRRITFLVGVVPTASILLVALCLRRRHLLKAARRVWRARHAAANAELAAKLSRFPGTPSIALGRGEGVLSVADVMVTWVVTDVEGSTQLWEWDAAVMDDCVERHNEVGGCGGGMDGEVSVAIVHAAVSMVRRHQVVTP